MVVPMTVKVRMIKRNYDLGFLWATNTPSSVGQDYITSTSC